MKNDLQNMTELELLDLTKACISELWRHHNEPVLIEIVHPCRSLSTIIATGIPVSPVFKDEYDHGLRLTENNLGTRCLFMENAHEDIAVTLKAR